LSNAEKGGAEKGSAEAHTRKMVLKIGVSNSTF
jgi:hypothetical protein